MGVQRPSSAAGASGPQGRIGPGLAAGARLAEDEWAAARRETAAIVCCSEMSLGGQWVMVGNLRVLLPVELVHDPVHYRGKDEARGDQEYQSCIKRV